MHYKLLKKTKPFKQAYRKGQTTRLWIGYIIQAVVLLSILAWKAFRKPRTIRISKWTIVITLWALIASYNWLTRPPQVILHIQQPHYISQEKPVQAPQTAPIAELALYTIQNKPPAYNDYDWGNCTWLVASEVYVPAGLGNANTWASRAASMGYAVSATPLIGAVATSTAGYYGHVALVVGIQGDQVLLREANVYGLGIVDERWVASSEYSYIYF